jgi:outer membrane protein assembly factor BamB
LFLFVGNPCPISAADSGFTHGIIFHPPAYDWPMFLQNSSHSGYLLMPSPSDPTPNKLAQTKLKGSITDAVSSTNGFIYATAGSTAYKLNGSTLSSVWAKAISGATASSPALGSGQVFFGGSSFFYALSDSTGSTDWRIAVSSPAQSSPAIDNGVLYFAAPNGTVFALDPTNTNKATVLWQVNVGGSIGTSSPASSGGLLAVGSNNGNVYFINEGTHVVSSTFVTGQPVDSSIALSGGIAYFGSNNSNVYAVNTATDSLVWSFPTGGAVTGTPIVYGGNVYVGSAGGEFYAINAGSGKLAWSKSVSGGVVSSAAIGDGTYKGMAYPFYVPTVYVSSESGSVYAFVASSGDQVWTPFAMKGSGFSSLILTYTHVYAGDSAGNLWELGALRFATAVGTFSCSPAGSFNCVYLTSFSSSDTIRITANARWGEYGLGNISWVNITSSGKGKTVVFKEGNMTFATGTAQYNMYYDLALAPLHLVPGTYNVIVQLEDANSKLMSKHPRPNGFVDFQTTFTIST